LLDGESRAEWITKNSNPAQIESIKESIIAAIHKVTSLPDLSDQNFSSNASGVAIKYKMIGAENIAAKQERKFKRGLQKRLSIIVDYINLVNNTNYSYLDVEIVFNRNMIGADLEIAQMIQLINGSGIPVKNLASQFSFITEADLASLNDTDNNTN
jgi:SPP1 family phage portal protein